MGFTVTAPNQFIARGHAGTATSAGSGMTAALMMTLHEILWAAGPAAAVRGGAGGSRGGHRRLIRGSRPDPANRSGAGADTGVQVPRLTAVADSPGLRWSVRLLGLLTAGWAVLALVLGPDPLANPIFLFRYVCSELGWPRCRCSSGRCWRLLNHSAAEPALQPPPPSLPSVTPRLDLGLYRLPGRVGLWPAVAGLFGFLWLEPAARKQTTIPVVLLFVASLR